MNPTKPFDAVRTARELHQFLQDAVGDIAADMLHPAGGMVDDDWTKRIKKAKKDKVRDLQGWLADELYNDKDTLTDLLGDRLYDTCATQEQRNAVTDELAKGHTALKLACQELREGN